jgi:hypothetical protein
MVLPIAEDRTYFSYIVPLACLIFRVMFVLKTFGIPVNPKIPPTGEIIIYILTMFFMLSAYYKKRFPLDVTGIIIVTVSILIIIISEFLENQLFIYEYREVDDEQEEE